MLLLSASEVARLLRGQEGRVLDSVRRAYAAHGRGRTRVPHSSFLLFPDQPADRIIALPAWVGDGVDAAGVKWVASFPRNTESGRDRASALLLLNSLATGHPDAVLDATLINAKRTAASAALAARLLHREAAPEDVAFVGCGVINFEIARFLAHVFPSLRRVWLWDVSAERMLAFRERLGSGFETRSCADILDCLARASLVSFATTASTPHVESLDTCPPESTLLHVSLRDLTTEQILACQNVVDDPDHVCREKTSLHLAEQRTGHRRFIYASLPEILLGRTAAPSGPGPIVFSPFGLGALDVAVGRLVTDRAAESGVGLRLDGFFQSYWNVAGEPPRAAKSALEVSV